MSPDVAITFDFINTLDQQSFQARFGMGKNVCVVGKEHNRSIAFGTCLFPVYFWKLCFQFKTRRSIHFTVQASLIYHLFNVFRNVPHFV